jgi:hypothetical protein
VQFPQITLPNPQKVLSDFSSGNALSQTEQCATLLRFIEVAAIAAEYIATLLARRPH